MQRLKIISIVMMMIFYPLTIISTSYAETSSSTSRINSEADVYVESKEPHRNFENNTSHNYAGYTYLNGTMVSYLKFDISQIPRSDLMHDIIIDSAQMRLLVQSANGSAKLLVTASYCPTNNWTAGEVTWEKRLCNQNNILRGVDSVVVDYSTLPDVYTLDVLGGLASAIRADSSKITFGVTAFPLSPIPSVYPTPGSITQETASGYVTFWSAEKAGYGFSAAPALMISYTVKDSSFSTSLTYILSTVLPTLAIIVPAVLWIYRRTKLQGKAEVNRK